jgi:hypothetical protein
MPEKLRPETDAPVARSPIARTVSELQKTGFRHSADGVRHSADGVRRNANGVEMASGARRMPYESCPGRLSAPEAVSGV